MYITNHYFRFTFFFRIPLTKISNTKFDEPLGNKDNKTDLAKVFSTETDLRTSNNNDTFIKECLNISNSEAWKLLMKNNEEGTPCLVSNEEQDVTNVSVIPEKSETKFPVELVTPIHKPLDSPPINERSQLGKQSEEARFSCLMSPYEIVSDADISGHSLNRSTTNSVCNKVCTPTCPSSSYGTGRQGKYVKLIIYYKANGYSFRSYGRHLGN